MTDPPDPEDEHVVRVSTLPTISTTPEQKRETTRQGVAYMVTATWALAFLLVLAAIIFHVTTWDDVKIPFGAVSAAEASIISFLFWTERKAK